MYECKNLEEHTLNERHMVKPFFEQEFFYSQKWCIPFSSLNKYTSPYFTSPKFKIMFALIFEGNGTAKLYGKLVPQNTFNSIKIYIRFGDQDSTNTSLDLYWVFQLSKWSCFTNITGFTKDQVIKRGFLDKENRLNTYIEISYYDIKPFKVQQLKQRIPNNINNNRFGIGLINENKICYMNSSLQILFHIPEFRRILYSYHCSKNRSQKVLQNIQFLFYNMENSEESCSAMSLHNTLKFCLIDPKKPKDACEFILALKDALETEIRGSTQEKKLNDLFQISILSNIECSSKSYKNSQIEYHQFLKVILNDCDDKPIQLIECLENFQKKSEVPYLEGEIAFKWEEFVTFPPVLQIHFLRTKFDYSKNRYTKSNKPIEFQETIDLSQFSHIENDIFDLYAILIHFGDGYSGGYFCYIRDFETKYWFKFQDSVFLKVESSKLLINVDLMRQVYMLIYVRKSEKERLFCECKIDPKTKEFIDEINNEIENEKQLKNMLTFRFVLEDEMYSPQPFNKDANISPKKLRIHNSRSNFDLYEEVAKLFDKNSDEIRLWQMDLSKCQKKLKDRSNNSTQKTMKNNEVFFVQNKKRSENVIPFVEDDKFENISYIIVFIEFFDSRMKIPLIYVGPLLVEENTKIGEVKIWTLLDLPESTRFHFFIKTGPLCVKQILPSFTFRTAQIMDGSTIVVQIDADSTANQKLPVLSHSKIFKGIELNENDESSKVIEFSNNNDNICLYENDVNTINNKNNSNNDANAPSNTTYNNVENTVNNTNNSNNTTDKNTVNNTNNSNNTVSNNTSNDDKLGVPNYKAVDFLTKKNNDLLNNYLALKYNMNHFYMYNYENQSKIIFTLDFPSSYSLNDMREIIKQINKYENIESIWIFEKYANSEEAATNFIPEPRFSTKLTDKSFSGNKIFYLYTPGITCLSNKLIYDVQIAPDGYNVTYRKTIVGPLRTNPAEILLIASKMEGFPDLLITEAVKDVVERKNENPILPTPEATHFLVFDVNKNQIYSTMMMNDSLELTYHSIRFVTFIPPEKDEILVQVFHVIIDENDEFDYIKTPFCINLKKNLKVIEFKNKVLKYVKIDDINNFMKSKLEVLKKGNNHTFGNYLNDANDILTDLTDDSQIYIIYNKYL